MLHASLATDVIATEAKWSAAHFHPHKASLHQSHHHTPHISYIEQDMHALTIVDTKANHCHSFSAGTSVFPLNVQMHIQQHVSLA